MIVVLGGIKGGCGKTTLATNLAVIRSIIDDRRVLLVDADEQHSTSDWSEHRESLGINTPWTTIKLTGHAVRTQIMKMGCDYDDIIVDSGGRDTSSQRAALTAADIFLTPFQPRSLDVWTIGKVKDLLNEVRAVNPGLVAYAVINRADPQGKDNIDAMEIIRETEGIECLDAIIGQRKAFANAASEGLSVVELANPDKKAVAEIRHLNDIIFNAKVTHV